MKSILIFSNGEKIGDGIIKLPLLNELKKRLPNFKIFWMTDKGNTVYNNVLKNISSKYVDEIYEKANINFLFWKKISTKYNLEEMFFDYIFDTQKSISRTIALKRIKHNYFISGTAKCFFSSKKLDRDLINKKKYYLENLYDLLDLIVIQKVDNNFKIPINEKLIYKVSQILNNKSQYIGIAPGAGEKNKIWPIENFIHIADRLIKKGYEIVFFIGPNEKYLKALLGNKFQSSIFIEDNKNLKAFSKIEIIMASTKYLKLAIANDSGVSHMLSTNECPLIKLFGPKDSNKFTPNKKNLFTISSKDFNSYNINDIPVSYVTKFIEKLLNKNV